MVKELAINFIEEKFFGMTSHHKTSMMLSLKFPWIFHGCQP